MVVDKLRAIELDTLRASEFIAKSRTLEAIVRFFDGRTQVTNEYTIMDLFPDRVHVPDSLAELVENGHLIRFEDPSDGICYVRETFWDSNFTNDT